MWEQIRAVWRASSIFIVGLVVIFGTIYLGGRLSSSINPAPVATSSSDKTASSLLPVQDIFVHSHDEDFLIVGSIENPDTPPFGQALEVAPEKVVVEVLRRGLLEREDLAALWIYSRHDVLDGSVLAGGVHRLENEEQ
jgi:hypothetical protein